VSQRRGGADALLVGDPAIEVLLRRNARARRMILRVAQGGRGPTLTLPTGASLAGARSFLAEHEGWLRQRLTAGPRAAAVGHGTVIPFGDGTLTLVPATGRRIVRAGGFLEVPGPAGQVGPRAKAWLSEAARQACAAGVARHAVAAGLRHGRITLRDPRSRWGSCSTAGDLMFSWRLIMAPAAVLDYVVAHEVAHLAEMNHSHRFWAVVRRLCPEYPAARDWLRRHGARLHGHDFTGGA
jgi:predicted metal-dependent hydrolase